MNLVIQASLDIGHWMCFGWSQTCRVGLIHFMAERHVRCVGPWF